MIVDKEIYNRLKEISELRPWNVDKKLKEFVAELKPRSLRTDQQRKGIELFCKLLADELNTKGKDMKQVIKMDIWWTQKSVKDHIFKPVMKAMYGYDSTTKLGKIEEVDKVHEMIMKELGEKHGIEYISFPAHHKSLSELTGKY